MISRSAALHTWNSVSEMTAPVEPEQKSRLWWTVLPIEQAAVLGLFCLGAPGSWSVYVISQGHVFSGCVLLCAWIAAMGMLGLWAHRRRHLRFGLTALFVAVVLAASSWVLVVIAAN
jgi:hypothetical protein